MKWKWGQSDQSPHISITHRRGLEKESLNESFGSRWANKVKINAFYKTMKVFLDLACMSTCCWRHLKPKYEPFITNNRGTLTSCDVKSCVFVRNKCIIKRFLYGGRESSTRCNFRKHMPIEKAPANQENNLSIWQHSRCKCSQHKQIKKRTANRKKAPANQENNLSIWQHTLQMLTTQTNKQRNALQIEKKHQQRILFTARFFVCLCCEHLQRMCCKTEVVFLICRCFLYLQHVELSRPPYF